MYSVQRSQSTISAPCAATEWNNVFSSLFLLFTFLAACVDEEQRRHPQDAPERHAEAHRDGADNARGPERGLARGDLGVGETW